MTGLVLSGSVGIIPRTKSRLLPDVAARSAVNIKLTAGEMEPYRQPKLVAVPVKTLPFTTIFRARNGAQAVWFAWTEEVDVCRMPLPAEAEPRFVWTGEGEPRWAPYSLAISGSGNDYPHSAYALGIPNPGAAPTVTPSGGSLANVNRAYCYTFFSQHGEESGPSLPSASTSGKPDGTWAIAGMSAFPTNSGSGTASHASGVTTFTNSASAATWLRAGDQVVIAGDTVTVIETPAADSFKVPGNYSAATTWARKANWNTAGMKRRLYRTAGTAGGFQLVTDDVGTTYNDTLSDANILGDDLISTGWKPPPAGLRGVMVTSFGSLVGFVGNQVWMTEPYQAHTWIHSFSTDYDIVAIALSGADLAIGTKANAYVGVGSDPSNFGLSKIDVPYPCLSKRSMVSDGSGALYSTKHGMAYMVNGAINIITEPWYTLDEWQALNPDTVFCEVAFDRLYFSYVDNGGARRTRVLDAPNKIHYTLDVPAFDIYQDDSGGDVFLATLRGIEQLDPIDGAPMAMELWSKEYVLPKPTNFGAAKIEFDPAIDALVAAAQQAAHDAAVAANGALYASGNDNGWIGAQFIGEAAIGEGDMLDIPEIPVGNTVSFTLYERDVVRYSRVVESNKAFKLPAGYKGTNFSVRVNSQCHIERVLVAETLSELATL